MSMPLSSRSFSSSKMKIGFAAAEDRGEHGAKLSPNFLEGFAKHFTRLYIDSNDHFQQLRLRAREVVVLFAEKLEPLFGFLISSIATRLTRPHFIDALLQFWTCFATLPSRSRLRTRISSGVIVCTLRPSSA